MPCRYLLIEYVNYKCTEQESIPVLSKVTQLKTFLILTSFSYQVDTGYLYTIYYDIQDKVERAQAARYSGVIVYNYKDDELIPMGKFQSLLQFQMKLPVSVPVQSLLAVPDLKMMGL